MMPPSIFNWIKEEEANFESSEIQLGDNWWWNFRYHVQLIFHLKNGIFFTGDNKWLRAFKNIMEPMLNLSYWTEDIEVKDVVFYIENSAGRVLSFFLKKYHDEVYTREHDLDSLFDKITESDLDYGGVLVQKTEDMPEVMPLTSIAFCDQTDILGGPIAFRYDFSPDKLREMSKFGWGEESNGATISLAELAILASYDKSSGTNDMKNKVTGKVIEVYILHGNLPEHYLEDNDNLEDFYNQIQIIAFYQGEDDKKEGVFLYRKKSEEGRLMFYTSKEVDGRALGRGEAEGLLHPQIWTNFLIIHKTALLAAASKVPLYTDDPNYTNRQKIQDMENLEITTIQEGKSINQVPTAAPANIQLYGAEINEWFAYAQLQASAFDPIIGKEATSGTTFRGQERTVAQGKGLHDKRRGQRAKFIEKIYRKIIIPDMVKGITDKEFLATFSLEEMTWVQEQLAESLTEKRVKEVILQGRVVTQEEKEVFKQLTKESFSKKGNKHLLKLLKDEFKGIEIRMGINVAGKQKDLAVLSDKILSIFQFIFSNPQGFQQAMQIPALANSFQDILEFSGMPQSDFQTLLTPQPMAIASTQMPQTQQANPAPMMAGATA